MITVEGFDELLDLGEVYANGLHSLRLFRVHNPQDHPVEVRFQSDLDHQLAIQTSNENLAALFRVLKKRTNLDDEALLSWTTNTVQATERALQLLGGGATEHQFNQLFNMVNQVDRITLQPNERRELVLSFLPAEEAARPRGINVARQTEHLNDYDEEEIVSGTTNTERKHSDYKDTEMASGHAAQQPYSLFESENDIANTPKTPNVDGKQTEEKNTGAKKFGKDLHDHSHDFDHEEVFFFQDTSGSLYIMVRPLTKENANKTSDDKADQEVAQPLLAKHVHIRARICRSFLWSDIAGAVVNMVDCVPGETYVKEFTVWNRSEIDLYYRLDASVFNNTGYDASDELSFVDADTGDPVGWRAIPGFGHRRLRATFRPQHVGNYVFDIRLENETDMDNCEEARIQASVKSLVASESLVVSDDTLDFGVCYSGRRYSRTFTIKNVSETPLEVRFSAQDADVKFYPFIKKDLVDTKGTAILDSQNSSGSESSTLNALGELSDNVDALHQESNIVGDDSLESHGLLINTGTVSRIEPIDEILLKPGAERVIRAAYSPQLSTSTTNYQAGQLVRKTFRIQLSLSSPIPNFKLSKIHKAIQCRAKACTSFIGVSDNVLNFGDTDVGVLRSLPLTITNYSELPAYVQIRFASKILSCDRYSLTIAPKQKAEVKFDIYPRKVNPDYRKQIEIVNLANPYNDQIVEIRSNNVDRKGVSFHSHFYRIITTSGTNFVDFGTTVGNSPSVRTIVVDNISAKELVLGMEPSDPQRIQLYTLAGDMTDNKQTLSVAASDTSATTSFHASSVRQSTPESPRSMRSNEIPVAPSEIEYLDLELPSVIAQQLKRKKRLSSRNYGRRIASIRASLSQDIQPVLSQKHRDRSIPPGSDVSSHGNISESSESTWSRVLALEKDICVTAPIFASAVDEEAFVQEQVALRNELRNMIESQRLIPFTELSIPASSQRRVVICYQHGSSEDIVDNKPKQFIGNVAIRLIHFDRDFQDLASEKSILPKDPASIPLRKLLLKAKFKRLHMEIGQRSINLGQINKDERRANAITIRNRNELPLFYVLKKSGSVLSGDISFRSGQAGVVRGFSTREVEFVYQPSLPGDFSEKITVENVLDPMNGQAVLVKAYVRKPTHFYLKPTSMNFGPCKLGQQSPNTCALMITNTDYQSRIFVAKVDLQYLRFSRFSVMIGFRMTHGEGVQEGTGALLSEDAQEKIEALEQKMKIARRKGRTEKVKMLEDKLERLRRGTLDDPNVGEDKEEDLEEAREEKVNASAEAGATNATEQADNEETSTSREKVPNSPVRILRTAEGMITFSLTGRTTEQILVELTLVSHTLTSKEHQHDESEQSQDKHGVQEIIGTIVVHEYKDVDASQEVSFRVDVHSDEVSYAAACAEWRDKHAIDGSESCIGAVKNERVGMNDVATKDTAAVRNSASAKLDMPEIVSGKLSKDGNKGEDVKLVNQTAEHHDDTGIANVEAEDGLEIGFATNNIISVEEGQTATCTIMLTNRSNKMRHIVPDTAGTIQNIEVIGLKDVILEPDEQRTMHVQVRGPKPGWHLFQLSFKEHGQQNWRGVLDACCYSHAARLLRFPSLEEESGASEHILDLGFCYLDGDSKYAQIIPLIVENMTDDELSVSCQSNLSQQVLIFADAEGTRPATNVYFKRRGVTTLWIALQPSIIAAAIMPDRVDPRDLNREIRKLIGGIRFSISAYIPEGYQHVVDAAEDPKPKITAGSQMLKFTALAGRSNLTLSTHVVNLGWTKILDEDFYGSFFVHNASPRVPAAYKLECSGGSLSVDRQAGTIAAIESDTDNTASAAINFRMHSSRYGLLCENISVINLYNKHQSLNAEIRLLVDDSRVSIVRIGETEYSSQTESEDDSTTGSDSEKLHALPVLEWSCVPVAVTSLSESPLLPITNSLRTSAGLGYGKRVLMAQSDSEHELEIQLNNESSEDIALMAKSDIGQKIRWLRSVDCERVGETEAKWDEPIEADIDNPFILAAGKTAILRISCADPSLLDAAAIATIERGEQATVTGLILIHDVNNNRVVKAVESLIPYGQSTAALETSELDFGQVGYVSSWQKATASFKLSNLAGIPLPYVFELPKFIDVSLHDGTIITSGRLEPFETATFTATLDPKQLEQQIAGKQKHFIAIRNLLNSENTLLLHVTVEVTTFEIQFERLKDGELVLPCLHYPTVTGAVPCDTWFKVVNTSFKDIRFEIGAELSEDVASFLKLDVLSRFSNSPLKGGVSLNPNGSIEVRIVASIKPGTRIPKEMYQAVIDSTELIFGKIWVTTQLGASSEDRLTEDITVRGSLAETRAFAIVEKSMQFASTLSHEPELESKAKGVELEKPKAQFVVRNLAGSLDFQFRLSLENPPGVSLTSLLDISPPPDDNVGSIAPGEQLTLHVMLHSYQARLPDIIRVRLTDINSITGNAYMLSFRTPNYLKKAELTAPDEHKRIQPRHPNAKEHASRYVGALVVRHCQRVRNDYNRFELNFGKLDVGSQPSMEYIFIHNTASTMMAYSVRIVPGTSASWLSVSQNRGRLNPYRDDKDDSGHKHRLTITATPIDIGVYTAHIVIESPHEPENSIIIRANMEVVTKQNMRRTAITSSRASGPIFTVSANCMDGNENLIDMPCVFYHTEYIMRSIVIHNHDDVTLPFTVNADLNGDPSDVIFSTSRTSAKLFDTLYIDGGHSMRVYIRFRPLPAASSKAPGTKDVSIDSGAAEIKSICIYVGCRLVKDYQLPVIMRAACYWPTLHADDDALDFRGVIQANDADINVVLERRQNVITIRNNAATPTRLALCNDSTFFNATPTSDNIVLDAKGRLDLAIEPRIDVLLHHLKTVRMEKYICEVMSVYNVDRPEERFWITVRITLGQSRYAQAVAVTHIMFAYDILEQHIVDFIRMISRQTEIDEGSDESIAAVENTQLTQLRFQFRYIVDHLGYYCTIKTGDRFFQLACLFFMMLLTPAPATSAATGMISLKHHPRLVKEWKRGLGEFLGIFPTRNEKLNELCKIFALLGSTSDDADGKREKS